MGIYDKYDKKQLDALLTGTFICPECGCKLIVDDDTGMLVCPECGISLGIEYFVPRSE